MAETLWCSGAASTVLHRSRIFAEQIQTPSLSQPSQQPGLAKGLGLGQHDTGRSTESLWDPPEETHRKSPQQLSANRSLEERVTS